MSGYPARRLRRLRRSPAIRSMLRETRLAATDLVMPIFVAERAADAGPIDSMPGVRRWTLADLPRELDAIAAAGVPAVLLFGLPATKDDRAGAAARPDGIVCEAVREIRRRRPELVVITDVCVCAYTDHGHCGLVREGDVLNDESLALLARMAAVHAAAGADFVAPSAMLDGMVAALRAALDREGRTHVGILSYAIKYASSLYGPFREAANSAPSFGDRRSYQMDPASARQAVAEAKLDIEEGADILMVKPALACLDIVRQTRDRFPDMPLAAYQVSGEYGMIKAAGAAGWIDERAVVLETLTAIRRAGADLIITYFAKDAAGWLAS